MDKLIPIEFKSQRILFTEQLGQVYNTDVNNIQANFARNKSRFIEGIHYYLLQGEELKEFKNQPTISQMVSKHASQLYLWTERGANRHCKILDTDKAWEQFDNLEETYFRVKENTIALDQLSPALKMFNQMFQVIAQNEIEQKKLQQAVTETKKEVQDMREVITIKPNAEWRKQTNVLIAKLCMKVGNYQKPKEEIYKALQERSASNLKRRLENMRARLLLNGGSKSKADNLNYLDVIAEDKKLIEIYLAIVKDMAIKSQVKINEEVI